MGYVYDVYYRDKAIHDENIKLGSNIGIIKFADEDLSLLSDKEELSDAARVSDDEDSNAEDFYQNDYPEDEDDDKGIVIGNEEEWYSEEEDYYKKAEYDERQKLSRSVDGGVVDRLRQAEGGFLKMDEIEHLYNEFYGEEGEEADSEEEWGGFSD